MIHYSGQFLLSLRFWWKETMLHGIHTSCQHLATKRFNLVSSAVWNTLKEHDILRPLRGRRGGRYKVLGDSNFNGNLFLHQEISSFNTQNQPFQNLHRVHQHLSQYTSMGANKSNLIHIKC